MPKPNLALHLVIGRDNCAANSLEKIVLQAVQGGVTVVQLREKITSTISRADIVTLGKKLKTLLKPYNVLLIINDHVEIALEIDADGVHIGQQDMDYPTARKILGPNKIIGLSVTNLAEATAAEQYPDIDYLGVGPVFATTTKLDTTPVIQPKELKEILTTLSNKPAILIGGITTNNIKKILMPGVSGIAVSSTICAAKKPFTITNQLSQAINNFIKI